MYLKSFINNFGDRMETTLFIKIVSTNVDKLKEANISDLVPLIRSDILKSGFDFIETFFFKDINTAIKFHIAQDCRNETCKKIIWSKT